MANAAGGFEEGSAGTKEASLKESAPHQAMTW